MTDDPTIEPTDLTPTRAELIAQVRARGRRIRARRRAGITALAALIVVAIAVPAVAIGSRSASHSISPATVAPTHRGDLRVAIVTRVEASGQHFGDPCVPAFTGKDCYVLGRTLVTAADVRGAEVRFDSTAGWGIDVTLSAAAARRLDTAPTGTPAAIIVGGRVLSAPVIQAGITGTVITVNTNNTGTRLSRAQAVALEAAILGGAPRTVTTTTVAAVGDLMVQPVIANPTPNAPCTLPAAGRTCLPLGPALFDAKSVRDVAVFYKEDPGQWELRITFDPAAAQILAAQTGEVAFVVGGYVQAEARMSQALSGNDVVIDPYTDRNGLIQLATEILGHAPTQVETRTLTASIDLGGAGMFATGLPVTGALVVQNSSSEPVRVRTDADGCRLPWIVELTNNGTVPVGPPPERSACQPAIVLTPGANRIPFTMSTRYASCNAHPVGDETACLPSGEIPPLPAGDYTVVLVPTGVFPTVAPVPVALVVERP